MMKKIWILLLLGTGIVFFGAMLSRVEGKQSSVDEHYSEAQTVNQSILSPHAVVDEARFDLRHLLRGIMGIAALLFTAWLFSSDRKGVSWKLVFGGLAIQVMLAIAVLLIRPVRIFFEIAGKLFVTILDFSRSGAEFLFGSLLDVNKFGAIFAFQILPTIVFFSALTSLLFYLGIIQKVVRGFAWIIRSGLKISGAESLTVAGNIFLGQLEAPLLVKGYLERMNRSEIMLVMVAGLSTIAGGVMAVYIGFLGGGDPAQRLLFARHLLTASVMAAPAAVIMAKILYPQNEGLNREIVMEKRSFGENVFDSISRGTYQGLKIAATVAGMLLVFLGLIAMINFIFARIGSWSHLNDWIQESTSGRYAVFNLQFIFGYMFSPVMWLIGICPQDMLLVGQLAGEKLVANEFVGYLSLASLKDSGAFFQDRSIIMATYLLCGFANFASVGMLIGGLGMLAPGKRKWISEFGLKALLGGTLASLLSATIIGMIIG